MNRLRKIPARTPAERRFRLVDGEAEQRRFPEMFFLENLFPRTGPVAQDFFDKFAHAAVRVGRGRRGEARPGRGRGEAGGDARRANQP